MIKVWTDGDLSTGGNLGPRDWQAGRNGELIREERSRYSYNKKESFVVPMHCELKQSCTPLLRSSDIPGATLRTRKRRWDGICEGRKRKCVDGFSQILCFFMTADIIVDKRKKRREKKRKVHLCQGREEK